MLPRLEALLRASPQIASFYIIDHDAPHSPQLSNFPHHYHDPQGNVTASSCTGDPIIDLDQVLHAL